MIKRKLLAVAVSAAAVAAHAVTTTLEYENRREVATRAAVSNDIAAAIASIPAGGVSTNEVLAIVGPTIAAAQAQFAATGTVYRADSANMSNIAESLWKINGGGIFYGDGRWRMYDESNGSYRPIAYLAEIDAALGQFATTGWVANAEYAVTAGKADTSDYARALDNGGNLLQWFPSQHRWGLYDADTYEYLFAHLSDITDATNAVASAANEYTDAAVSGINVPTTAADVGAYPNADGTNLAAQVSLWEYYWSGSNVVFEVTNYYGNTSGEIPRLRIKEYRDNTWRTVYDVADWHAAVESNIVATAAEKFAPRAWGSVTSAGVANNASGTVWHTAPSSVFAGGMEFQRVAVGTGAICVLADNGAPAYTAGSDGTFRFQDFGGTNYFGFSKTDSYTLGCATDGITKDGGLVTLRYDVIMAGGTVPIVYWREDLQTGEWVQLNNPDGSAVSGAPYTVTWVESGGSYYAAINCGDNPSGYFYAETFIQGMATFETNMRAYLNGGIACTNSATGAIGVIRPVFNGSTVTWQWSAN